MPTTWENYDERGRIKQRGKRRLSWKPSLRYLTTRRRKATRERGLATHRKSLHGSLVHEIVVVGTTIITEKASYRAAHETVRPRVWDFAPQGCS